MKILSREQIRDTDAWTIKNEPVVSIDLMERASNAFTESFLSHFNPGRKVYIFCGTGNNGGDGLAVSRMLLLRGFNVKTCIVRYSENCTEDFLINLERLKSIPYADITEATSEDLPVSPVKGDIIVDALWGTGLTRPVGGFAREIISRLNCSGAEIVALDIPSGLFCDSFNPDDAIIKASLTLSFQLPKLSFFFPENARFTGRFEILDIGLSREFIDKVETPYHFTEINDIRRMITKRNVFAHKGQFGHALLVAGSFGKIGAAVLGSKACLRCGAGLHTTYIPGCGYEILQTAVPEAMILCDPCYDQVTAVPQELPYDAIGIGPGLGTSSRTANAFHHFLDHYQNPVVLDADALNILSANPRLQDMIPPGSILTPHIGEFARLTDACTNHEERLQKMREFSVRHKCNIVLKGAYSAISDPSGNISFNSTGNPGMATAGSGDVLTGIITSFLAQGYAPNDAARIGVFIHGLAGDLAADKFSQEAMIAGDIISMLPMSFKKLRRVAI